MPYITNNSLKIDYESIGYGEAFLMYVKQAHQSKADSQINIIPQKNHMQLFFSAEIITALLLDFIFDIR